MVRVHTAGSPTQVPHLTGLLFMMYEVRGPIREVPFVPKGHDRATATYLLLPRPTGIRLNVVDPYAGPERAFDGAIFLASRPVGGNEARFACSAKAPFAHNRRLHVFHPWKVHSEDWLGDSKSL